MYKKINWFDYLNYFFMLIIMIIMFYPMYHVLIVSISSGSAVITGKVSIFPVDITLMTYKAVLNDPYILNAYKNTLVYTSVGVAINLVMTMLCAYPLSRSGLKGRRIMTAVIMVTMFINGGLIPLYLLVSSLNMINSIWAIVLPTAISTYNMIIMRTFFLGIPNEMHESAHMDGATEFNTFIKIILPLSKSITATMLLFYAVSHWNSFFPAMIYLNDRKKFPLQIILRNIVILGSNAAQSETSGGASDFLITESTIKYATIIVATLPIMAFYPFIQKHFVKGVMIGSLKG